MTEQVCDELTKLASETIDRLGQLEVENAALKEENRKLAAAVLTPSDSAIDKALDGLLKSGSLKPDQIEVTRQAFKSDPDAAYRAIAGLTLDASSQVKTATNNDDGINGGSVVSVTGSTGDYKDAMLERMTAILNG